MASTILAIPCFGYLMNTDVRGLNLIQNNLQYLENFLEDIFKKHEVTTMDIDFILTQLQELTPSIILVFALYMGASSIFSVCLILGVVCEVSLIFFLSILCSKWCSYV